MFILKKKNLYCYCRCYQRPFSVNDSCDAKVLGNLLASPSRNIF